MGRLFRRVKRWRWFRPFAIGAGSIMDLSGQSTLRAAQALADEMEAELGPVSEAELRRLREQWPRS